MKFDFIIGNPPYQDETLGDNKGFAPPIYQKFLENAYEIADVVEMIHPARFLFNAGSTPKDWNNKMLQDEHLKILYYETDATKIFPIDKLIVGITIGPKSRVKRKELQKYLKDIGFDCLIKNVKSSKSTLR